MQFNMQYVIKYAIRILRKCHVTDSITSQTMGFFSHQKGFPAQNLS